MYMTLKAVIFDMDGVLIESEHLWRKAMIKGFEESGMILSEDDCRKTMGLRIGEVIDLWIRHFKVQISAKQLENRIIQLLLDLIEREGKFIAGIPEIIALCKEKKIKLGLATSSSEELMNAVLKKLGLSASLDATVSAEHMKYGKPHPEVFLVCAEKLKVAATDCLVIEDSLNGVIAGKAAQMTVVAVPDDEHTRNRQFAVADHKMNTMHEVLALFKTLFP
jgi:HAD superfamily hydrolase (TIGR01509 family)